VARKSKEQRLIEGSTLKAMYEDAMLTTSWEYGFLTSVLSQMESGRYPSKRQRDKFDIMINEGVPKAKGDTNLLAQIDNVIVYWANNEDRSWECSVLRDLRQNVFKGWQFSEKQTSLLNKLFQKCDNDKSGKNIFHPSDEQVNELRALTKLYYGYAHQWQLRRPALGKAVDRVIRYLAGEAKIEKYHFNKLSKAMGARLKKFQNPRFEKGDLSQVRLFGMNKSPGELTVIFCMSDVYVNEEGEIVNDWMVPASGIRQYDPERLPKRLKK
jgi:hypothetical protein